MSDYLTYSDLPLPKGDAVTDVNLLPLPERLRGDYRVMPKSSHAAECEAYARANVEHHTAPLHAEIAELRAEELRLQEDIQKYMQNAVIEEQRAVDAEHQRDMLAEALREAREDIESWAGYASPYFQEKHDLAGTLEKYDEALARASQPAKEQRQ